MKLLTFKLLIILLTTAAYSSPTISQKEKHKEAQSFHCPDTKTTEFDKVNSLEYLGFTASRFLLNDGNATFYLARGASFGIVAIHYIADDEAIIDATARYYTNGTLWGLQYSDEMIKHYSTLLLPCLDKLAKEALPAIEVYPNTIRHYTQSKRLFSIKEHQKYSIIFAPIYTEFSNSHWYTGKPIPWIPKYDNRATSDRVQSLGRWQANTLNEAIANRTELDQLAGKSSSEIDRYFKDKTKEVLKKKENVLNARAEKKGVIYRDSSYWSKYNGNAFQAIFNGDQAIESTNGFTWVYGTFVSQYYRSCQDFIPPGSPGYDYTKLTTISNSLSSTTFQSGSSKIRMKEKFFKQFEYYEKKAIIPGFSSNGPNIANIFQNLMSARNFNRLKFAKESFQYLSDDISRLFSDGKCDSGFLMQFEENLYRLANNLVPLQKDNKMHPYRKNDA